MLHASLPVHTRCQCSAIGLRSPSGGVLPFDCAPPGGRVLDSAAQKGLGAQSPLWCGHGAAVSDCAQAFIKAADLIESKDLSKLVDERYAGWKTPEAEAMLAGKMTLADIAKASEEKNLNPQPKFGEAGAAGEPDGSEALLG